MLFVAAMSRLAADNVTLTFRFQQLAAISAVLRHFFFAVGPVAS
jgi:hypothetical protein